MDEALNYVERHGTRGERKIARALAGYGVRFEYEHPVAVIDRGRIRIWYPDFVLPHYSIAIEYAGVEGNADYARGIEHRKEVFEASGFPYLVITPSDFSADWPKRLLTDIHNLLAERLRQYEAQALDVEPARE